METHSSPSKNNTTNEASNTQVPYNEESQIESSIGNIKDTENGEDQQIVKDEKDQDADENNFEGVEDDETDYPKLFEKYQERFHLAYSNSQKLFNIEQAQRETLNYYHRRNIAILDLLLNFEKKESEDFLSEPDRNRLENVIQMNPKLKKHLAPLLNDFDKESVSKNHKIDLFVTENIPELISDDLKGFEVNPQDIDSWCRRHYPNLVISKFRPLNLKPIGVDVADKELVQGGPKLVPRKRRKLEEEADEK